MTVVELKRSFGLNFLSQLTKLNISYALLRNINEIALGEAKDIDLIAPKRSFKRIIAVLKSRNDVKSLTVIHSIGRGQCVVVLNDKETTMAIDVAYHLTLVNNTMKHYSFSHLTAVSILFSDLKTCTVQKDGSNITLLQPSFELFLLKNHALSKRKKKYIKQIEKLESEGVLAFQFKPSYLIFIFYLMRRYFVIFESIPNWFVTKLQNRVSHSKVKD